MKGMYKCNNCSYFWKSKKDYGMPSICPNCKKKDISYDSFKSAEKPLFLSLTAMFIFIVTIFMEGEFAKILGYLSLVFGLPSILLTILIFLDGKRKNEKLRISKAK